MKGYFEREKINFHEKNLKYRKITFFYRFLPNFKKICDFNKLQEFFFADNLNQ